MFSSAMNLVCYDLSKLFDLWYLCIAYARPVYTCQVYFVMVVMAWYKAAVSPVH